MPSTSSRHELSELLAGLASNDWEVKLGALRHMKNKIIGKKDKKLDFVELGAVAAVAKTLSDALNVNGEGNPDNIKNNIIIQSATVLGSFACGFDAGAQAVINAGAFFNLARLLSIQDAKVVDAGARSLRMVYQSKLAPKYNFLQDENMKRLISLLSNENENVSGLGASIITHSCKTTAEQVALCDAGILEKLTSLLEGSISQRDASLESLATILKNNTEVVLKFVENENGRSLDSVIELAKNKYPRTRLLACICLIVIRNTCPSFLQDIGIKAKLVRTLLELLEDPCVGDEAPFAFSSLIAQKEELQRLALEASAIEKLYCQLQKDPLRPKYIEGILLALADMCSMLESCRDSFLKLEVLDLVTKALSHDSDDVCIAACICIRSVSRSVKNLCAGHFMKDTIVTPLVKLFIKSSTAVQVAALGAISNIVVDFTTRKSAFIQCGGLKELVQLSESMDGSVRSNALWALRNLIFLADNKLKEDVFIELKAPLLASLISDPEPFVQEQAMAFVRNLVDGCIDSIEYAFTDDSLILKAIGKQLQSTAKVEIRIQGMYVLSNVAAGKDSHKEAVMNQLLPQAVSIRDQYFVIRFLQSSDSQLRTATVWALLNVTHPRSDPGAFGRYIKLQEVGIITQIKNMINDPCLEVKLRVRTILEKYASFGGSLL
ncbi:hypothetical protein SLEP1_g32141 [Rubroshorea leprosula]|uniref:Armadillo repeat-containing protein 8 n=1 Tax=Rubroshorea leprosula TaxID=152421 RepID=A0AAV5KCF8_9ROSI|nr:hypothetical protein SLEP1_g32141 [Rubroshorea leprosula]